MDLEKMSEHLNQFAKERDWDQFHRPKNLAMALAVEAAELMEPFQWLEGDLPEEKKGEVQDEIADVLVYLMRLAQKLDISLEEAFWQKMEKNAKKYPPGKVYGSSKKYTEYS